MRARLVVATEQLGNLTSDRLEARVLELGLRGHRHLTTPAMLAFRKVIECRPAPAVGAGSVFHRGEGACEVPGRVGGLHAFYR